MFISISSIRLKPRRVAPFAIPFLLAIAGALLTDTSATGEPMPKVRSAPISVWGGSFAVTLPKGFELYPLDAPLPYEHAFHAPSYVATSTRDGRAGVIMHLGMPIDPRGGDFFSPVEKAASFGMRINGMRAWSRQIGAYEQLEIELPKPKGCDVQVYALLVFVRQDSDAKNIANSFRPLPALQCFTPTP